MTSDKTLVLMDTNKTRSLLYGSPRYDTFDLGSNFKELRRFIDENNLSDYIILAVTEMTLKELLVQKKEVYENDKSDLITASNRLRNLENASIPDFTLPHDSFDCIEYIKPKVETFLHDNKVLVIKIDEGRKASVFDTLFQKAVDRRRPSEFKDAVIFETLNQSDVKNNCINVILLTGDNGFDGCEEEISGINFKIIKSNDFLIEELKSIYAENLREKKYNEVANNQYLITNLKEMIASEFDATINDVDIMSLTEKIIDEPIELKKKFSSLNQDAEFFENMVCFVSKVTVKHSNFILNILIDLGSNEIETIQTEII